MEERIHQEASAAESAPLWKSTSILVGLRYPREVAAQVLREVRSMRKSTTYQAILDEGRSEGERKLLLLLGTQRFGPPDASMRAAIESIESVGRLEQLADRLLRVSSWDELLAS